MPLSTIEAVFEVWQEHVVWFNQTAEVALWNTKERAFCEFYVAIFRISEDLRALRQASDADHAVASTVRPVSAPASNA